MPEADQHPSEGGKPVPDSAAGFKRVALTAAHLRALRKPATGRVEVADLTERGLRYRLTATGSASWSLLTTGPDGKQRRVTLGAGSIPLAKARELAVAAKARLASGDNPTEAKRASKARDKEAKSAEATRAKVPTVSLLVSQWQAEAERDTSPRYRAEVEGVLRRAVGADKFNTLPADAITAEAFGVLLREARERVERDARARRDKLAKREANKRKLDTNRVRMTPDKPPGGDGEARHLIGAGGTVFGWAKRKGLIQVNPVTGWLESERDGRKRLPKWTAAQARERVLSDAELSQVWETVAGSTYTDVQRAFVALLMLTACRAGEIGRLDWREVDLKVGEIHLPARRTKNGVAHRIALGPWAVAILTAFGPKTRGLVLGSVMSNPTRLLARVRDRTGIAQHWTWHDLRRTAATGLARMGVPVQVTEAVLNHTSGTRSGITAIYQRHDYATEARAALLRWQAHVAVALGAAVRDSAEVVPLRGAQAAA